MKTCPYCAEQIKDEAVICKHCHQDLKRNITTNNKNHIQKTDDVLIRIFKVVGLLFIVIWTYSNVFKLTQDPFPELTNRVQESNLELEKLRKAFEE